MRRREETSASRAHTAAQRGAPPADPTLQRLLWLADVIARNDPAEQEKIIKFNSLLANCVIFHTALDMTAVIRQYAADETATAGQAA